MSIYSAKLAHVQVIVNCRHSFAQMYTREDTLPQNLSAPYAKTRSQHKRIGDKSGDQSDHVNFDLVFKCYTKTWHTKSCFWDFAWNQV